MTVTELLSFYKFLGDDIPIVRECVSFPSVLQKDKLHSTFVHFSESIGTFGVSMPILCRS